MAETGEETYYIVGESRTNVDNAITKVYGSFFIAFEVIPSTGEIIQTDCSRTLELTNDFIRKLFLHKHLETDAKVIEEAIQRRAAPRERGGDQPCGGYDPEDLQCLRDPAEPYFLDRVVYHRDAGDEGAEVDHADAKNFKLRDGYVEAGPAE